MQREAETGQGSILGADEGLGMGRDENAAEAKLTGTAMAINAKPGTAVRYMGPRGGSDVDKSTAERWLVKGRVYTVERTDIDRWSTAVWLRSFYDHSFNVVFFDEVEPEQFFLCESCDRPVADTAGFNFRQHEGRCVGCYRNHLALRREVQIEANKGYFDNPPINDVLCAADVLLARLDRDAKGQVHPEIKYAVLVQVMRSIATEQVGASASVKALALAALEVCCE